MLCILSCVMANTWPMNCEKVETEEKKHFWGESGTEFISESETKMKDPALLDNSDCDWIDVDGLRELSIGKAALIDETNRNWIGKEVVYEAEVVHGAEIEQITEEEAEAIAEMQKKERIERALDNDYIDFVDEEEFFLPSTVNPFETAEVTGFYETPEVIMGSRAMVIFTKPDGTGWHLESGDILSFKAEQYLLETKNSANRGRTILFGYLLDGKLHQDKEDEGEYHQYTLRAKQAGEYFITIYCRGSLLTLKKGRIENEI